MQSLPAAPVPMFPLPRVFLFPHQVLPLHVFEPRYRAMVADLLDTSGRLVLATIADGEVETTAHVPEVRGIAGLGEIMRHRQLDGGRSMIWLLGLARVRVHEVPSEHPYRLVRCSPFDEVSPPEHEEAELVRALRDATAERLREELPLPESAPAGFLADLLLQVLRPPPDVLAEAFAEPSVAARARFVLAQAARTPPPA